MNNYRKTALQPMEPWLPDTDMDGVSVSEFDKDNGSPKLGDMIAHGEKGDRWLVALKFFEENYEKASHQLTTEGVTK